jgi:NADPH:quinone reductase-like Zn-dependent oxidoreductase
VRAAVLHAYGEPPAPGDRPAPPADQVERQDRVLVEVTAAPVVPLDLLCASGTSYLGAPALPYVPGVQGVGRVATTGERVWFATSAGMAPGDGSLAEDCSVAAVDVIPLSADLAGVADDHVAAIGLSGVAAWMCLTSRAALQPGERVLVLGAGSVVGQVAVAAARQLGAARVVAACRSDAAEGRALRAGADAVVRLLDGADVGELAAAFTAAAEGPVDVVLDPVFGVAASAAAQALAAGGRLVNLGGLGGDTAELSSAALRGRSASVLGYTNNALTPAQRADALVEVLAMAAAGSLEVDRQVHALDDVATAWTAAEASSGVRSVVRLR